MLVTHDAASETLLAGPRGHEPHFAALVQNVTVEGAKAKECVRFFSDDVVFGSSAEW